MASFFERVFTCIANARDPTPFPGSWLTAALGVPFAIVQRLAPADVAAFVAEYPTLNVVALGVCAVAVVSLLPPLRALVAPLPRRVYTAAAATMLLQDSAVSFSALHLGRCLAGYSVGVFAFVGLVSPGSWSHAHVQGYVAICGLALAAVLACVTGLVMTSPPPGPTSLDVTLLRVATALPLVLSIDALSGLCGVPLIRLAVYVLLRLTWQLVHLVWLLALQPLVRLATFVWRRLVRPAARGTYDSILWGYVHLLLPIARAARAVLLCIWRRVILGAFHALKAVLLWVARRLIVPTANLIVASLRMLRDRLINPTANLIVASLRMLRDHLIVPVVTSLKAAIVWLSRSVLLPMARATRAAAIFTWDWLVRPLVDAVAQALARLARALTHAVHNLHAIITAPPPPWLVTAARGLQRAVVRSTNACARAAARVVSFMWHDVVAPSLRALQRALTKLAATLPIALPLPLLASATTFATEGRGASSDAQYVTAGSFFAAAYVCVASANLLLARAVAHDLPQQNARLASLLVPLRRPARAWEHLCGKWVRHLDLGLCATTHRAGTAATHATYLLARFSASLSWRVAESIASGVAAAVRFVSLSLYEALALIGTRVLTPLALLALRIVSIIWHSPVLSLGLAGAALVLTFRLWRGDHAEAVAVSMRAWHLISHIATSQLPSTLAAAAEHTATLTHGLHRMGGMAASSVLSCVGRPLINLARDGVQGVLSEALLLLAALLEGAQPVEALPSHGSLPQRAGLLGQRSFALLVVGLHVLSARRGVYAVRRTHERVAEALLSAQRTIDEHEAELEARAAHPAPTPPPAVAEERGGLASLRGLFRVAGVARTVARTAAGREVSAAALQRERTELARRRAALETEGRTLHTVASEAERAMYAACCRAAAKVAFGPVYTLMVVGCTPYLRWLLVASPLLVSLLLALFVVSFFGLNLSALPLVLISALFSLPTHEPLWTALLSDWVADYDASEREMFRSVHALLEVRAEDDARRTREQASVSQYALLAQTPPWGTPCFDADEMGDVCPIWCATRAQRESPRKHAGSYRPHF
jgi:hypothetical protein